MKCYEYLQETVDSILDDNWRRLLKKHGSQGWILCTINREEAGKIHATADADEKAGDFHGKAPAVFNVFFRRAL